MNRTTRAALVAGLVAGGSVFLIGVFLAFDVTASALAGLVMGSLGALLIAGASARGRQVDTRVQPRFPGPPDHEDDDQGS